jgi:transcriptional regulator with AAA-type ATPase domain
MAKAEFDPEDRAFGQAIEAICYVNPFSRDRQEVERRALGGAYQDVADAWALGPGHTNKNLLPLKEKTEAFLERVRARVPNASQEERQWYGAALRFFSYYEFRDTFTALVDQSQEARFSQRKITAFGKFQKRLHALLPRTDLIAELFGSLEHLFAIEFQFHRAFHHIFDTIVGASGPAQRLRERVWESVFTCDRRRYERGLYRRMHRINTLVLGPSGTGKELVARAIGLSRYLPFDRSTARFEEEITDTFLALNISALSPSLVESELFGHKRGSFTGAVQDRAGFFEVCPEHGTVFLDEVGELSLELQVKLLRTLQTREFQRVGEVEPRRFEGKLVSATNRDLVREMERGTIREDFYYRLCSDVVETPSLRAQLADNPRDLGLLVSHVAKRHFEGSDADEIAAATERFIETELGLDYPWPGNVRELEQCVLNIAVRGEYRGPGKRPTDERSVASDLSQEFLDASMDVERLLDVYCTLGYQKTGSFSEAGRRIGIDRRTIKARLDRALLSRLRRGS